MEGRYHYRKKPKEKRRLRWALLAFILIVLLLAGLIGYDLYKGQAKQQTGTTVTQTLSFDKDGAKVTITEPTFTLKLPADWKEVSRVNNETEKSITWQATKAKQDNRFMAIYIDKIPRTKSYNHLLPLEAVGQSLRHGSISDNCIAFTEGGSFDPDVAVKAKDTLAKWEDVTFWCDLPRPTERIVGTSSKEAINMVGVSGPEAGRHNYFFLYTDHNVQQDFQIFIDIVSTFSAR